MKNIIKRILRESDLDYWKDYAESKKETDSEDNETKHILQVLDDDTFVDGDENVYAPWIRTRFKVEALVGETHFLLAEAFVYYCMKKFKITGAEAIKLWRKYVKDSIFSKLGYDMSNYPDINESSTYNTFKEEDLTRIVKKVLKENVTQQLNELAKTNRLILLDVDDTLLKPTGVYIYRKLPSDPEEIALTPFEYGLEEVTPETKQYYDYRDFVDPIKTQRSIEKAEPIVANLSVMDDYLKLGHQIGILTARANEDIVFDGLKQFLMYKDSSGNLVPIGDRLSRENVYAVNDTNRMSTLEAETDYEKKAEVVEKLLTVYDEIVFIDDDMKNIKQMRLLKRGLPKEIAKKLFVMHAKE